MALRASVHAHLGELEHGMCGFACVCACVCLRFLTDNLKVPVFLDFDMDA